MLECDAGDTELFSSGTKADRSLAKSNSPATTNRSEWAMHATRPSAQARRAASRLGRKRGMRAGRRSMVRAEAGGRERSFEKRSSAGCAGGDEDQIDAYHPID